MEGRERAEENQVHRLFIQRELGSPRGRMGNVVDRHAVVVPRRHLSHRTNDRVASRPTACPTFSRQSLRCLRLRPPRHARSLPGVRDAGEAATRGRSGRVRSRLFNVAAAVSLLLCAAALADWCSHPWGRNEYAYGYEWTQNGEHVTKGAGIETSRGTISLAVNTLRQP